MEFTLMKTWRRCKRIPSCGNANHAVGVYQKDGVDCFAFKCSKCHHIELSDQRVEEAHGG